MRIGIDVRSMVGEKTGVGRYTENLVHGIAACNGSHEFVFYSLFVKGFRRKMAAIDLPQGSNVRFISRRVPGRLQKCLWAAGAAPIERFIGDIDVLVLPEPQVPAVRAARVVSIVHDCIPLVTGRWHPGRTVRTISASLKTTAGRADAVIAVSHNTKKDLVELTGIEQQKVKVVHESVGPSFRKLEEAEMEPLRERLEQRYGIGQPFLLYAGTIEPRKNLKTLFSAFSLLKSRGRMDHRLVIAGKRGWMCEDVPATVRSLGIEGDCIFAGYVPDDDLVALYNAAELFLYPSYYEGFGLPPLEAMACGTPVVASNVASLPEVVGEAAVTVAPDDAEGLAGAVMRVLGDGKLREEMSRMGLARARLFSRQRMARETLEVIEEVVLGQAAGGRL